MVKYLCSGLALALAACSPAQGGAAVSQTEAQTETQTSQTTPAKADIRTHPISGLRIIDVTVKRGEKAITFDTELADTAEAQTRGLMFRTELADDEAMIFPTEVPQRRGFWMKNTPISLDIIFIGPDRKITNIAANTVPYSLESVPSAGLASAVFEIRGGLAEELGIVPGDKVSWVLPED